LPIGTHRAARAWPLIVLQGRGFAHSLTTIVATRRRVGQSEH
jgi:hypothetical protein